MGHDQHLDDLFSILEEAKDGFIVDCMYGKYNESVFDPPLIVVFTNLNYCDYLSKLSQDRWFDVYINSDQEIELRSYDSEGYLSVTSVFFVAIRYHRACRK